MDPLVASPDALSTAFGVLQQHGHFHVVALRPIREGEVILEVAGVVVPRPTRHSLQVGADEHLAPPAGSGLREQLQHHPWAFLDHACEPNAWLRGRELVAIRPIQPGDAITFHYATTEWDMAEPFACRCGSPRCLGTIRGFRHLDQLTRARLRPHLAPHLLDLLDSSGEPMA